MMRIDRPGRDFTTRPPKPWVVAERRKMAFSRDLNSLGPGFLLLGGPGRCLDPEMIDDPLPGVSPHKISESPQPPAARGGVSNDARTQFLTRGRLFRTLRFSGRPQNFCGRSPRM